jgi:V/A-type H+-transporting ATPase subunit I
MEYRRMIVPMKKVTLLCQADRREFALHLLQQAGLIHLTASEVPSDDDLDQARDQVHRLEQILRTVESYTDTASPPEDMTAKQAADRIWDRLQRLRKLQDRVQDLTQEKMRIEPFGYFDPQQVKTLQDNGVYLTLCKVPEAQEPEIPAQTVWFQVNADHNDRFLALFSREHISPPGREVKLPIQGLADIERELGELKEEKESIDREMSSLCIYGPKIRDLLAQTRDKVAFLQAKAGMDLMGPVAAVQGFIPEHNQTVSTTWPRKTPGDTASWIPAQTTIPPP